MIVVFALLWQQQDHSHGGGRKIYFVIVTFRRLELKTVQTVLHLSLQLLRLIGAAIALVEDHPSTQQLLVSVIIYVYCTVYSARCQ